MTTLEVVAVLQLAIILLLLEPQEQRKRVLAWMAPFGLVCAAIYYLLPGVIGLLYMRRSNRSKTNMDGLDCSS